MKWRVRGEEHGRSLQEFLELHLKDKEYSKRKIKSFIDAGFCTVNGKLERFSRTKLAKDSVVELRIREVKKNPIVIIYEDDDLLILDKPSGITCDARLETTLAQMGRTAFLVHRLDKETTGVLLLAKSIAVRDQLMHAFQERLVQKEYVALVDGQIDPEGSIENYLGEVARSEGQVKWGVVRSGQLASTSWKAVRVTSYASLVALYPKTGRTHQLRVHMEQILHPILGDKLYGERFKCRYKPERQLLHAKKLSFSHPKTATLVIVEAALPHDFNEAIRAIFNH